MSEHRGDRPGAARVLIVEDEVLMAMSLAMDLRNAGYEVADRLPSGEEAVEFMRTSPAEVVIMDIRLTGEMDGIEAAAQIREFSEAPIVFMSGYADREHDPAVAQVRPAGFMIKPVSFPRLRDLLARVTETDSGRQA